MTMQQVAKGKHRSIWAFPDSDEVYICNETTDAKAATATACQCFALLEKLGIKTHLLEWFNDDTFRARRVNMIPVRCVVRRIATGSFLARYPVVHEGEVFPELCVEFFLKESLDDRPFLTVEKNFVPLKFDPDPGDVWWRDHIILMRHEAISAFATLENNFARQRITLADLEIEFGVDRTTKNLIIAATIDNDSWTVWPATTATRRPILDPSDLTARTNKVVFDHDWAAQVTAQFLS